MNPSLATAAPHVSRTLPVSCAATPTTLLAAAELGFLARLKLALDAAVELHGAGRQRALQAALSHFTAHADLDALLADREHHSSAPTAAGYRRHLLLADPQGLYSVVAIVWSMGQYTPVHGHHTWCAYSVSRGTLAESCFDWCEAAQAAQLSSAEIRLTGEISYTDAGRGGIHRLGNPHPEPAISVHVYGVPGEHIATAVNDVVAVDA